MRKNTIAEFPYISWPMQLIKFTFKRICLSCLPFLTPVLLVILALGRFCFLPMWEFSAHKAVFVLNMLSNEK